MIHVTKDTPRRMKNGLSEILIFSITQPGWTPTYRFDELSLEIRPGQLACPSYGCKVYENPEGVRAVFHNNIYGCPRG